MYFEFIRHTLFINTKLIVLYIYHKYTKFNKMPIKRKLTKNYSRKEPGYDYMKYWRVIRYWAKDNWGLTYGELDMMFFLYSEGIFNKTQFDEFNQLLGWDRNRFGRLKKDEWISVWRTRDKKEGTLYEISYKGKRMIKNLYDKLNGKEFSEGSKMFNVNVSYNDKMYRNYIKKINKSIRQQQRLSQE